MARDRDRFVAIGLSVLLHGALIAALAYGWWLFRRPPRPAPALAIEATVVDARTVPGLSKPAPPPPVTPAPPAEELGPPPPSTEELAHREQQQKEAAERAAAQQAQAEQRAAEERAAAEKGAQEKAAAEAKQAAEEKRKAQQAAAAAAAAAAAEAQEQSEREADLKRGLAAEARSDSAASNEALASWRAQITAKITRAWLRPPTARAGLECDLYVAQVPGGEVTQVKVGQCNGDQAVRDSIEAAVYRASPLPPPPDPALFDRSLKITFKPDLN